MLQITDDAAAALVEMSGGAPLRFIAEEVDGEMEFEMADAKEPEEGDEVIETGGARVFLDATAAAALADQVLEVQPHGDHVHFNLAPQQPD